MSCPTTGIAFIFTGALLCAHAQWLNYPSPGTPRTRDGKPNLSAKAPRASNGKPDLSGVWQTELSPPGEIEGLFGDVFKYAVVPGDDPRTFSKYFLNILADFKPDQAPIKPETAELARKNAENARANPSAQCLPQGIVRDDLLSYNPFKIIQTPGVIAILYEVDNMFRQVYMDGRKLPADPQPAWVGYSVGKWDGDTLVVDSAGFNDRSWLDAFGHPHSEALRIQERFHRRDFGHMDLQLTIDDPKMYTRPFTIRVTEVLVPDSDILEYVCEKTRRTAHTCPEGRGGLNNPLAR
jgi:hypothetical protein